MRTRRRRSPTRTQKWSTSRAGAPPASLPAWGHLRLGPHPALVCPLPWATGARLKDSPSPDGPPTSASLKCPARPQEAPAQVVAPHHTQANLVPTAAALSSSHRTTATRLSAGFLGLEKPMWNSLASDLCP